MKIRPKFFDEDGKFAESYIEHINKYPNLISSLVYKSFGGSFFHDGLLTKFKVCPGSGTVELKISAPNFHVKNDNLFLCVDFKVKFLGIDFFTINNSDENLLIENKDVSTKFLRSEFNSLGLTSDNQLAAYSDLPFECCDGKSEILMEFLSADSFNLGMRFSGFEISPIDSEIFYLVAKASGFNFREFG